jgi:hypothetical protein
MPKKWRTDKMKFKVGDRVKVVALIGLSKFYVEKLVGEKGTIVSIKKFGTDKLPIEIRFDKLEAESLGIPMFSEEELILIEDKIEETQEEVFTIVKDYEYGEDGVYTVLVDKYGDVVLEGDWYHNKIDETINGFFHCLKYLGFQYEVKQFQVNVEDDYLCDLPLTSY